MNRGIYAAASGGLVASRKLQVVSNNLANVNTVGFRADRITARQQEFSDTLAAKMEGNGPRAEKDNDRVPGVIDIASFTDFAPGPVSDTGNPLHAALRNEKQFFVVNGENGEEYTRAGNFTLNAEGNLVTADGKPVSGDGGPLTLPPGDARIRENGDVVVSGEVVGKLKVVQFEDMSKLRHVAGTRFKNDGGPAPESLDSADLVPGALEMPNVNVVEAMVDLMSAQRSFEAYTKTVTTIDELHEQMLRTVRGL